MSILARIESDLKEALKNREETRLSVLRLIKASAKNRAIEKQSPLTDEELQSILSSQIKQRRESIDYYLKGNRAELAEKEQKEIDIIKTYLPEQLSEEEIDKIIKEAMQEANAVSEADMGSVMKIVMPKTRGKADGRLVNERVKAMLRSS